jgi:ClpP class serine protease
MSKFSEVLNASRLLITREQYLEALCEVAPLSWSTPEEGDHAPTFSEVCRRDAERLSKGKELPVTANYADTSIPQNSLAYYRIKGMILASESSWRFSTKQFQVDMVAADANPAIIAHFVHVNSGGGEAWYLDRAAETMKGLRKPVYALVEKYACSAAYYLIVNAGTIRALTQNDIIGSVGTMVSFMDIQPALEKMGVKFIEEYATKSDLKNKKFNDLTSGKPKQYIQDELDPLQAQFEAEVRSARRQLSALPEDSPAVRGETYDAIRAIDIGLIDGITTMDSAIEEAHNLGVEWARKNHQRQYALTLI